MKADKTNDDHPPQKSRKVLAVALGAALAFLGVLSINVLMSNHSRELRGALSGGWIVLCISLGPLVARPRR